MRPHFLAPSFDDRICCSKCNDIGEKCCCPTRHASASSTCTCRIFPMELFLVSKQMTQEAKSVFFFMNCLEFKQDHYITLEFLKRLGPQALWSIRQIRFWFTDDPIYFGAPHLREEMNRWQALMELISQNLTVSSLTVCIHIEKTYRAKDVWNNDSRYYNWILKVLPKIVQRVSILQDLKPLRLEFSRHSYFEAPPERQLEEMHAVIKPVFQKDYTFCVT